MKYRRVLLKLSGEALLSDQGIGIDSARLDSYAGEIKRVIGEKVELAIVIGGGNIFRGAQAKQIGIDRVQGDYMGMLATLINGIALQSTLENIGIDTRLMSSIRIEQICEPYISRRAIRHLEKDRVVIFAMGTGNPFFTTDTAASLRAAELEVDILLKATHVGGIYTADPKKHPDAQQYDLISFQEVIEKGLKVMDMTAFTLCLENKVNIIVFDMNEPNNLYNLIQGAKVGTLVSIAK